ncbi:MAG: amino acid adenylation domain-containing protein, partial [Pseudomonadales bacterium]
MQTPLTSSQELLWMGEQLDPGTPLYNMVFAWFLHGEINPSAFQQAFERVLQQSDALRLSFSERDGKACQTDNKNHKAQLVHLDFSAASDPRAEFCLWAQAQAQQPFDISQQVYQAALVKLAHDEYVWYLNQHHLITDAASCEVLFQRMSERYLQAVDQTSQIEQAAATSFLEYVRFEQAQLGQAGTRQAIDYWRSQLQSYAPNLAFYGNSGTRKTVRSRRVTLSLSAEQSAKLQQLATHPETRALTEHLSLFNLFAGLLVALLSRVTGESTQQLGVLLHNRATPRLRATAGMFIEVCPLVLQLDEHDSLKSLVNKVKTTLQTGLRYVKPGVSRAASNSPFEVILNYLPFRFDTFAGVPVSTDWIHPNAADPGHKLRLQVHDFDANGRYQLLFDLNQAAFDTETSARILDHFMRLLDACLQDPEMPIGAVDLLSVAERRQRLHDFNNTSVEFPAPSGVIERFERQARSTPDALAIIVADAPQTQLSYAALDGRANQLAWFLLTRGVGRNTIVPLLMQRSADMPVALLAVLKAGAAYLPLEPDHPQERNAAILTELAALHDLAVGPLITQSQYASQFADCSLGVLELDRDWLADGEKTTAPGVIRNADDLAYLIFTSGSTGKPKGTLIQERGLSNYIDWASQYYLNDMPGNLPLFTSLAFDLTVTSVYLPLTTGGCVHIYNSPEGGGLLELPQILSDDAVDLIKLTPSHLALLNDTPFETTRLRGLILGGENLPTEMARWAHRRWQGRVDVFNEYGPTEATVGCMIHRFDAEKDRASAVPIGQPVANTQVYLLDSNRQPVVAGIAGELCVGGAGVGLGYLQRDELTREQFVENPFGTGRLYRTGDLARWREDGSIEFLGRADRQIKLHGARIELDEIASVLQQHPVVKACAVDLLQRPEPPPEQLCSRCGLSSRYPGSNFDAEGLCNACRDFDSYRTKIEKYFRTRDDLHELFESARREKSSATAAKYDCIMLLSGGKDSTYALYQLVCMGLKVLSITLDNGYISDTAKANIQRVVDDLGIDHRFETTPHMNAIFADSLARHSNVCNGCFKTIYSL